MIIKYQTKTTHRCPVNNTLDVYDVTIETPYMIKAEDILSTLDGLPVVAFQESLTEQLAKKLGAKITTVGYHSGVRTEVTA